MTTVRPQPPRAAEPPRATCPFLAATFFLAAFLFFSCDSSPQGPDGEAYRYTVPEQVEDGWSTGSLSQAGVDSTRLVQLMEELRRREHHLVHAILLVKDGVLVFEEYFAGDRYLSPGIGEPVLFHREMPHFQASVSKSVTATAVGIVHDRGLLELDAPALSFFPGLAELAVGGRERITLEDLLTMRSGLPWDESSTSYTNPANDVVQLFHNPDPIRYILSKEMEAPAGTWFRYNSGATNVLGKVVEIVSGQRLDHLAADAIFAPLGIQDAWWELIREGLVFASGGLRMRPRDMAKIGQLYLQRGVWNGQRILSEAWVDESRVPRSRLSYGWADGYGFGWWTRTYATGAGLVETYFASGWGEQQIIVVPDLNLVAVFTGGAYEEAPYLSPGRIMAEYVLPALLNRGPD